MSALQRKGLNHCIYQQIFEVIIINIHATYDLLLFIYFYITLSLLNDLM